MTASQARKLDQLRENYREGKISPEEYVRKALQLKDGDTTRQRIAEKVFRQLAQAASNR